MKKFSTKLIMLLSMICLLQVSCKKDDTPVPVDNTSALLQNKNWKLTAGTVSPVYFGTTNWYNDFLDDCNRDDLFRFNAANLFVIDEGPSKCNPSDPQTQDGSWTYTESTKVLHFTLNSPSDSYDLTITQINENSFTGNTKEVEAGVTYTNTWVFTKQ